MQRLHIYNLFLDVMVLTPNLDQIVFNMEASVSNQVYMYIYIIILNVT